MNDLVQKIKEKIDENLKPEEILLIDKSYLHASHKSFNVNKFYLKLTIKSKKLKNMKKVEAHKVIYTMLKDEMKSKIHALEIDY